MGKSGSREDGDLLAACDEVHFANEGDAGLDHNLEVVAGREVDGRGRT